MPDSPDQHLIDALARKLGAEPTTTSTNGNGHRKHCTNPDLSEERVIELCRKAENAKKFAGLYDDGDTSGYQSASEADAALISIMAFYTQDEDQLDELYRRSALMRPKWNRGDYRQRTSDFVLDNLAETWQGGRDGARLLSSSSKPLRDSSDDDNNNDTDDVGIVWFSELGEPKKREFLIDDVCAKGYPLVAFGAGGVAKSFAMLSAGITIAGGHAEWLGMRILEHGPVLYLDFELDKDEQHRRVRDLCAGMGVSVPDKLAYLPGVGITAKRAFARALRFCEEHKAVAVIIDSMGLAMQGDMEQAKDVLAFHAEYINPLRRAGVTPLIVDHEGKLQSGEKHRDKSPFGSAYKAWAARSVLQFELDEYDRENSALYIRVRQTKTNFGPKIDPFGVRFAFEEHRISTEVYELEDAELAEEQSVPARERIIGVLRSGPATRKEMQDITGLSGGTIRNNLSDLMKDEIVGEDGYQGRSKVYRLLSSSPEPPRGDDSDDDNQIPLSADLQPGESTSLPELKDRRDAKESPEAKKLIEAGWTRRDRGSDEFWTDAHGIHYSMEQALRALAREEYAGTPGTPSDCAEASIQDSWGGSDDGATEQVARSTYWQNRGSVVHVNSGEPYDVYIGHKNPRYGLEESIWANPYNRAYRKGEITRGESLMKYREYILSRPDLLRRLPELRGKVLACWCASNKSSKSIRTQNLPLHLDLGHNIRCHGQMLLALNDSIARGQIVLDDPEQQT
jgi:hypothetical protein